MSALNGAQVGPNNISADPTGLTFLNTQSTTWQADTGFFGPGNILLTALLGTGFYDDGITALPTHTLEYLAGLHGTIDGISSQQVSDGGSGSSVSAMPDSGYHFVEWSDHSTQNPRIHLWVNGDISITAIFEPDTVSVQSAPGFNLNTQSPVAAPTASPTPTIPTTSVVTPTPTTSATPSVTPTPTPTPTPAVTPTPTPTPSATSTPTPATITGLKSSITLKLNFANGSSVITTADKKQLTSLASKVKGLGSRITIATTDYILLPSGKKKIDKALSQNRATAISSYLFKAGVSTKIKYLGAKSVNSKSARYFEVLAKNK